MSQPDRYVVIGNPIAHSKSPDIHARFAAQTGEHLQYERLLVPLDGFADALGNLMKSGCRGANVTVPFKLEAFELSSQRSERAEAAGAVNTLRFDGTDIHGDNTDGVGLVNDILCNTPVRIKGARVLLLGAGGAARGVILPLLAQEPAALCIANRTVAKAEELAERFQQWNAGKSRLEACGFEQVAPDFDIIINATSASLSAELPPVPAAVFREGVFAYDMMYGKEPTVFMRHAASHGATARDGLGMLIEQAAEAFFVWRGVRPDTGPVHNALRAAL
ncbi:shikimate dehydrogenase [Noviherbaspirillum galbum]|uniref:Shikimate dehydrogenase (NADP(+)) n=1 Tax=Noviherbaspirillum galbum TaxID=2709383 RepID=A0A6B3SZ86_9BURK|nr:shikimate dehydrogenase [Noviherbaspirillum galbum]NEX64452.1 shikimate dehydrogenase [Noviherbaspirillum galbum]